MTRQEVIEGNGFTAWMPCKKFNIGSLAQSVEQLAFNQLVASSNLARPTISLNFISTIQIIYCLTNWFKVLAAS